MSPTVSSGPYVFFSLPELEQEKIRYKEAMKSSGSDLVGSSVNGQTFQFGPRHDWSLTEWGDNLLAAFAEIAPGKYGSPPGNRTVADFNSGVRASASSLGEW